MFITKMICHMSVVRMMVCSSGIQIRRSDISPSRVPSDKYQHILSLRWLRVHLVFSDALWAKLWRALTDSRGRVALETDLRALIMNGGPLTLSVWSLGHSWGWWSLPGNEFQKAASIIHTYKSTAWPLFLEMKLNEGWPYLGAVLLICRWVAFRLVVSTPSVLHLRQPAFPVPPWLRPWEAAGAHYVTLIWLVDLFIKVEFRCYFFLPALTTFKLSLRVSGNMD